MFVSAAAKGTWRLSADKIYGSLICIVGGFFYWIFEFEYAKKLQKSILSLENIYTKDF